MKLELVHSCGNYVTVTVDPRGKYSQAIHCPACGTTSFIESFNEPIA